jgi:serine/threonine protein kinase
VFLARDAGGTLVALKVLHPQLAVSVTAERFLREIGFLSRLEHPRIARLLDYGEADWLIYYVMTYVEGPTLRDHLARARFASVNDTVTIAAQLLDALAYAHAQHIVHRDVKPDNVVLERTGVVLLDFGIARAIAEAGQDRLTRSGFAVGTSAYMSPEQVEGAEDIDHRSDIYSLGCVLFECLAGKPPFTAGREEVVLRMHVEQQAPAVEKLRRDAPRPLCQAIMKALATRREDRWQTAEEMRREIEDA